MPMIMMILLIIIITRETFVAADELPTTSD